MDILIRKKVNVAQMQKIKLITHDTTRIKNEQMHGQFRRRNAFAEGEL